jgi:hypothetical protein
MTFLGHLRRSHRLSRCTFAVFVLALLQTALVPCVMAMTAAQTASVATAATDTLATAMADMPDCVYCPSDHSPASAGEPVAHDCFYPHESSVGSSTAHQLQLEQLVLHPVFISSSVFSLALEPTHAALPARHLLAPITRRSITLTYCVQLK